MGDERGAAGAAHIIRWRAPDEAAIEADGAVLAVLRVRPDGMPDVAILRRPATPVAQAALFRSLRQALRAWGRPAGE